jgi:hypothetical protein
MSKYLQGVYNPVNKDKYIGKESPVYRSSWELKYFRWADSNPNILSWGSENIIIPYLNPFDNKIHRYFVDSYIIFKDRDGIRRKMLIEIKPSKQVSRPVVTKGKQKKTILHEQTTWIINQKKWEAAKEWAEKKGAIFTILTEKELGI